LKSGKKKEQGLRFLEEKGRGPLTMGEKYGIIKINIFQERGCDLLPWTVPAATIVHPVTIALPIGF
jgi:hypothetical protein